MGIFHFFSKEKKQSVPFDPTQDMLVRCTHCSYEIHLLPREVRLLETRNAGDPVCSVKEKCDICHIGFMIPAHYTDQHGKLYLFHDLKPKIKNLDPNTVTKRIFGTHFL
jgi:hypothetical protein